MKHYVRLCRPRFEVTVLEIDAEDDVEAGFIALENADSLPERIWHLQDFDGEAYQPHVEECHCENTVEAEAASIASMRDDEDDIEEVRADYIERLRSPEANDYTRYMLLKGDINSGEGAVVFEPWFREADPGLLEADIAGDWIAELKSTVEDPD